MDRLFTVVLRQHCGDMRVMMLNGQRRNPVPFRQVPGQQGRGACRIEIMNDQGRGDVQYRKQMLCRLA